MFPKNGSRFPSGDGRLTEADYVAAVSDALKLEFGTGAGASKQIQRWTNASDRTARNWLNGQTGPNGCYLMLLARESDAVLSAMLTMAARSELAFAADLHAVEVALAKATGAFEVLRRQRSSGIR